MSPDLTAGRLQQGDEFVVVSRKGKASKVSKQSYLVEGVEETDQQNNKQIIGKAKGGETISIGQNTKVKKVTSNGLLPN